MPKGKGTKGDSFEGYLKSAMKNAKKEAFSEAMQCYNKAIKLNPNSAEAFFGRGRLNEILGKRNDALEDYNKAIDLNSNFDHVYVHRAILYAQLEEYEKALKDLKKAYELSPFNKLNFLYNSGRIYISLKKYKEALNCFNKALKSKPPKLVQPSLYANRGVAYSYLKKHDKALEDFNQAIKLNPENGLSYYNRGVTYHRLEQYAEAIQDWEKAIELEPTLISAYLSKGGLHRQRGEFEKALEAFRRITEQDPKNPKGHFASGLTYETIRQFDKALEEYDKTLELDPDYAHVYTHKGIILGNLCAFEESICMFNEAIRLNSKEDIAYLNRAVAYSKIGKHKLALKDFETAIKMDPSDGFAHFGKGKTLCYLTDDKLPYSEKRANEKKIIGSFRKALSSKVNPEFKGLIKWWIQFFRKYCDASVENKKRLKVFSETYEDLLEHKIFFSVHDGKDRFSKFMSLTKTYHESDNFFQVLRRWNSFTPIIPGKSRSNLGGGYFFVFNGQGIVIDPGYNFIENFIENGFSLGDIDSIVLTHAHDDHTADFESLLSMFSKLKGEKKIQILFQFRSLCEILASCS